MFANVVQPKIISLFSSTGSAPLQLFSKHVDPSPALRSDSLIHLLNDTTSVPPPPEPGVLVQDSCKNNSEGEPGSEEGNVKLNERTLCQTVLHIQSPTLRTTYIRCPPRRNNTSSSAEGELGMTHPWIHIQARRLGEREWAFEVGITDRAGRKGIIRCSTFQKEPSVALSHDLPVLRVPLCFPASSPELFTPWTTISVDLGFMIPQFRIISAAQQKEARTAEQSDNEDYEEAAYYRRTKCVGTSLNVVLPSGGLGRVTYVKVFANCRLRRIWFSDERPGTLPWEFQLYSSSLR